MKNLLKSDDYKKIINAYMLDNKSVRGYQSRMAQAAKCQKSHFSLIVNGHHHLSCEQALRLADYWGLNEQESEYFICTVEIAKTNCQRYLQRCQKKLKTLRKKMKDFSKRYTAKALTGERVLKYYSRWEYQAIHALISIPDMNANKISTRLRLSLSTVSRYINDLVNMGLIEKNTEKLVLKTCDLHISESSPLNWINHHHWRQKAVKECQNNLPNNIHFSAVYAMSVEDANYLKIEIYKLVDKTRKLAIKSTEENVFIFTTDWFEL